MDGFRDRDEHRVAGRMRLMLRDVEVADPEREVDRVEIFERLREVRQVKREKDERERSDARLKGSRSG